MGAGRALRALEAVSPSVLIEMTLVMLVRAAAFSHSCLSVEMVLGCSFGHGNGVVSFQSRCPLSGGSVGNPAQHNEGPALRGQFSNRRSSFPRPSEEGGEAQCAVKVPFSWHPTVSFPIAVFFNKQAFI